MKAQNKFASVLFALILVLALVSPALASGGHWQGDRWPDGDHGTPVQNQNYNPDAPGHGIWKP